MDALTDADREALRRAMRMKREFDPRYRDVTDVEIDAADDEWLWSYGIGASFGLQLNRLQLKPWQCPPCHADDEVSPKGEYGGMPEEVSLLKRMRALGLSRFEPDPLAAIDAAEAKAARAASK